MSFGHLDSPVRTGMQRKPRPPPLRRPEARSDDRARVLADQLPLIASMEILPMIERESSIGSDGMIPLEDRFDFRNDPSSLTREEGGRRPWEGEDPGRVPPIRSL
jgi:hypothetical protein